MANLPGSRRQAQEEEEQRDFHRSHRELEMVQMVQVAAEDGRLGQLSAEIHAAYENEM